MSDILVFSQQQSLPTVYHLKMEECFFYKDKKNCRLLLQTNLCFLNLDFLVGELPDFLLWLFEGEIMVTRAAFYNLWHRKTLNEQHIWQSIFNVAM